ncbi:hypothetical protein EMIHUDRAFT_214470 [Emiliania huxleyi CCMP1516]|uniref:Uncharacterized protein n=2 Tax=Emiliania huxleyi TaxID=2903 RepID=A0A0D3IK30_EMIH1|nr:hypothetical protein EMIHUDRAFT_214470 [Emiliania huxleyi CCMP1516]EOD11615.1 hypothetical protein EMIHUDRAFT_214470 [Emiliania huxleyi CCMP1516]|eukprot:XP_005764044.1 hypothetical protein EMIHUDRAFT_214470 [Emiliania huxleyi CCMP1516]
MAVAVAAAPISLTDEDRQMTVEQYLKAAASERAAALKRHGEELIERYDAEFKRARKVLRDAAVEAQARSADDSERDDSERDEVPRKTATTSEPSGSSEPSVDAFALVGIRGVHQGKIFKVEPAADRKTWSIGRTADNDFCLSGDDEVSSDLGSTNGTFTTNGSGASCKLKSRKNHQSPHQETSPSAAGSTFKWCYHSDAVEVTAQAAKMASRTQK